MATLKAPHLWQQNAAGTDAKVVRVHRTRVHVRAEVYADDQGHLHKTRDTETVIEQDGRLFQGSLSAPKLAQALEPGEVPAGAWHTLPGGARVDLAGFLAARPLRHGASAEGPAYLERCGACGASVESTRLVGHLEDHLAEIPRDAAGAPVMGGVTDAAADDDGATSALGAAGAAGPARPRRARPTAAETRRATAAGPDGPAGAAEPAG